MRLLYELEVPVYPQEAQEQLGIYKTGDYSLQVRVSLCIPGLASPGPAVLDHAMAATEQVSVALPLGLSLDPGGGTPAGARPRQLYIAGQASLTCVLSCPLPQSAASNHLWIDPVRCACRIPGRTTRAASTRRRGRPTPQNSRSFLRGPTHRAVATCGSPQGSPPCWTTRTPSLC